MDIMEKNSEKKIHFGTFEDAQLVRALNIYFCKQIVVIFLPEILGFFFKEQLGEIF